MNEKENCALLFLLEKLSKNELVKLISEDKNVKKIESFYKNNYKGIKDFKTFSEQIKPELLTELKKSKASSNEIKKALEENRALQPCVLNECYMSQTLANLLGLVNFADFDEKKTRKEIPSCILKIVTKIEQKYSTKYRYLYWKDDLVLFQNGAPGQADAIFAKGENFVCLEYKNGTSRMNERDIAGSINDEGKIIPSKNFQNKYPTYCEIIQIFNETTSVFKCLGSNFPFGEMLSSDLKKKIFLNELTHNKTDLYLYLYQDIIYPLTPAFLLEAVSLKGSEIRTAGKNSYKVNSKKFLEETLINLKAKEKDGYIFIDVDEQKFVVGRGMNEITRYSLNELFFVRTKDYEIRDNIIFFKKNNIKQKKPNISLHTTPVYDEKILKAQLIKVQKDLLFYK